MKIISLLLVVASSSAVMASAAPAPVPVPELVDVHTTNMKLAKVKSVGDRNKFKVTVTRTDDIFDVDSKGTVKDFTASKVTQVTLSFDVGPKGEIMCNGMPVALGISTVKVKARISLGVFADSLKTHSAEEIANAFDDGIVAVKLDVSGEQVFVPEMNVKIQRITIKETILEVNGKKVQQTEAKQQILDIHPNGSVQKHAPCGVPEDMLMMDQHRNNQHLSQHAQPSSLTHAAENAAKWYHKQDTSIKVASAFMFGSMMALISMMFIRACFLVYLAYASIRDYSNTPRDEEEGGDYLKQINMENMEHLPVYKEKDGLLENSDRTSMESLPAYEKGYAAVQTEEH